VLEHVSDLDRVVSETARVLRPGGLYLFDTINRTLKSKLDFGQVRSTAVSYVGFATKAR
jgi:2-polyprenyl-3-methyl-5-hydroxy-6-metoxy-1,4-benzoquinol methylase